VIEEQRDALGHSGDLRALRAGQQRTWMWALIRERLDHEFRVHPAVVAALPRLEAAVEAGAETPDAAADALLAAFAK
jgi:LAO/AO transport system kinase